MCDLRSTLEATQQDRNEMSNCTTVNISSILSGDAGLAEKAKKSNRGLRGVQNIVRWVVNIMQRLAQYGKELTTGRVTPLQLLGFATYELDVQPTKLCEETLSAENVSSPLR